MRTAPDARDLCRRIAARPGPRILNLGGSMRLGGGNLPTRGVPPSAASGQGERVMQARFNLMTLDPLRLDDAVKYIEATVRPEVESLPGSLGLSLYANRELGVVVLESFWASRDLMRLSEQRVSPSRREVVRQATGTVSVERYEVPVFEQEAPPGREAGLRLTRMDIQPRGVQDVAEAYGDTAVPWLADTHGFCATLLLADWDSGHLVAESTWRDAPAMAASRSAAAGVRVSLAGSTGCVIRAVEEYGLVFNSAHKPWQED